MFPLGLYNYIEIGTLLISAICFSKIKHSKLKWLFPYLLFIVAVELVGRYIARELRQPVGLIFNFSVPIEYIFFSFLYYLHYKNDWFKHIAIIFLFCFSFFVLVYSIAHPNYRFHAVYLKIGTLAMIIFSCFYFADILRSDVIVNPLTIPMFWIATGVLLFNAGEFVSDFMMDILFRNRSNWVKMFKLVNNNLIVVLYSCISIAIILTSWGNKEKT